MKHLFLIDGREYGSEIMRGGAYYEIDINGGTDLRFGVAACGLLKFSVFSPHPFSEGTRFVWKRKQIEEKEFSDMGVFTVHSVTRRGNTYDVEARDDMASLDVDAKSMLESFIYPTTHIGLLEQLCMFFGISVQLQSMANSGLVVDRNPYWDGATARDILSMIAEASACFAHFLPNGKMYIGGYRETGTALTNANYSSPFIADYTVSAIDKVQVRSTQGDIGYIAGTGKNTYIVEGNPLFAVLPVGDTTNYAYSLLLAMSGITYTPCEIPLFNDNGLRVGDWFEVDGVRSVVMSYRCTPSGTVISCTGSPKREVQSSAANRDIISLIGKTNELTRTSELTESRLTDAEGEISSIRQTSDEIVLAVGDQNIKISSLETEISGVVKFSNLTDGVTQISGDNITTGTIRAINIDGCVVTSNGDIYTNNTWAKSKVTVTNGAIQFKCEFDTGVTTLSQLSSHEGLSLSSTSTININSTESITLEGPGVIFAITGNMYVIKNGYIYEVIHSGNIHQYV